MLYVVKKNSKISCSSRTPFMHNNQKCARLVCIYIYIYSIYIPTKCINVYHPALPPRSRSIGPMVPPRFTPRNFKPSTSAACKPRQHQAQLVRSKPRCDLPSAQHLSSCHKVEPKKSRSGARCGTR